MPELSIAPDTRVAELLAARPELEQVLVDLAPAFRRLQNPVLRRTVARLATLETAAGMARLAPRELVRRLREAAGQPADDLPETDAGAAGAERPDWVRSGAVVATVDADALLDAGQMPLNEVIAQARQLSGSDLMRLTVAFKPTPVVDALRQRGLRTFLRPQSGGGYELWIGAAA